MEFKVGSGYCDLNVCSSGDAKSDRQLLRRAFELGYETVALTSAFDQKNLGTGKKAVKKAAKKANNGNDSSQLRLDFPAPPQLPPLDPDTDYPGLKAKGKAPKVLKRLTLTFNSNDFLPAFNNSATVKNYDLLALIPASAVALQNLLKSGFRADIIRKECVQEKWHFLTFFGG